MSLDQLCTLAGVPKRTVRYYIQLGLLPRPIGETRAAHYLPDHLDALLRIKQLSDAGISLARIQEVLAGEPPAVPVKARAPGMVDVRSHVFIAPGIELQISPEDAHASAEQVRALTRAVVTAWQQITKEAQDEE